MTVRTLARAALLLGLCTSALGAQASGSSSGHGSGSGSYRYCDAPLELDASQKDRLFRWGGVIKDALEQHAAGGVALVSRSGLDLARFGHRYSHAGVSLQAHADTPWAVRQLYYACDEGRPRLYDQGITGFLLGTEDPREGYVSVVLLPEEAARPLEAAALDRRGALSLLAGVYSANAYAYGEQYQNCNQWVAELLAQAWSGDPLATRGEAQQWLRDHDYRPSTFDIGHRWFLSIAMAFVPWLHRDDHPAADLRAATLHVSMPAALEDFVRREVPGATRLEFCHNERHMVVRRGWSLIADGCEPGEGDTVIPY